MSFHFKRAEIPDVVLIEPRVFRDDRGFFAEVYKEENFAKAGLNRKFVQINHSRSQKNVLRGLHYQKDPSAQAKLVRVLSGEIFDVAVDLRKGSPFYGRWVGAKLDSAGMHMLYIPEGFAHGFCVISDTAEVEYFCTSAYSPGNERGIVYNDPDIRIDWPVKHPVLSEKDTKAPRLKEADHNFIYEE